MPEMAGDLLLHDFEIADSGKQAAIQLTSRLSR